MGGWVGDGWGMWGACAVCACACVACVLCVWWRQTVMDSTFDGHLFEFYKWDGDVKEILGGLPLPPSLTHSLSLTLSLAVPPSHAQEGLNKCKYTL
jgi:hypothetical protein